jgi:hypothetical protein
MISGLEWYQIVPSMRLIGATSSLPNATPPLALAPIPPEVQTIERPRGMPPSGLARQSGPRRGCDQEHRQPMDLCKEELSRIEKMFRDRVPRDYFVHPPLESRPVDAPFRGS